MMLPVLIDVLFVQLRGVGQSFLVMRHVLLERFLLQLARHLLRLKVVLVCRQAREAGGEAGRQGLAHLKRGRQSVAR